jgi:hypothetical protein
MLSAVDCGHFSLARANGTTGPSAAGRTVPHHLSTDTVACPTETTLAGFRHGVRRAASDPEADIAVLIGDIGTPKRSWERWHAVRDDQWIPASYREVLVEEGVHAERVFILSESALKARAVAMVERGPRPSADPESSMAANGWAIFEGPEQRDEVGGFRFRSTYLLIPDPDEEVPLLAVGLSKRRRIGHMPLCSLIYAAMVETLAEMGFHCHESHGALDDDSAISNKLRGGALASAVFGEGIGLDFWHLHHVFHGTSQIGEWRRWRHDSLLGGGPVDGAELRSVIQRLSSKSGR